MRRLLILLPLSFALGCIAQPDKNSTGDNKHRAGTSSPATQPSLDASAASIAQINQAAPDFKHPTSTATESTEVTIAHRVSPFAVRAEVLLARARFSPGVADGQFGTNLEHAITAYQQAHGIAATGSISSQTWQMLLAEPAAHLPAARSYIIASADIAGPFAADVGEDFVKLAALPNGPQFTSPVEALAEHFHMSQALLKALNPGVNFSAAGARIIVVDDSPSAYAKGDVARIDVAKAEASVRAYNRAGGLIGFYPATVGSTERPSPSGMHKVVGVGWNAKYTYDPARLAWGPRAAGRLVIKPGPNNPVGTVWIDLDVPGYGLHGTPDPDNIGKTASHGCVRMTNWDAQALAAGVKPGVIVQFIGKRGGSPT